MNPIVFKCRQVIPKSGAEICAEIADTARWREFHGYGILPGIVSAAYEKRTDGMVGSQVRVRSADGSEYVEEIYRWVPGEGIGMRLHEFTPPLSRLATHFTEEWTFRPEGDATLVAREIQMFPSRSLTRPVVWLISLLFKRAIARHLARMAAAR